MSKLSSTPVSDHDSIIQLDGEIKSIKRRVSAIEKQIAVTQDLTLSVNKLATNMDNMLKEQVKQGERLDKMERAPIEEAKYYKRQIISCIITSIVGAIVGAILCLILK